MIFRDSPRTSAADSVCAEKKLFAIQPGSLQAENRVVLIIPGFGRKPTEKGYRVIGGYYQLRGITPVYVSIDWFHTRVGKLAAVAGQIAETVAAVHSECRICVFGFSFGAAIACKVADLLHPEHALLCSMSPVFAGDPDYQHFPFREILRCITGRLSNHLYYSSSGGQCLVFLYGERDNFLFRKPLLEHREKIFSNGRTIIVKGARHNISGVAYRETIKKIIREIP